MQEHTSWITHFLPADQDGRILSAEGSGSIYLWASQSGEQLASFVGYRGSISRLLPRPSVNALVTAGSDRSVRVWRLDTGEQLARFQLEQRPVNMVFSRHDNDIVVSDAGGAVHFLRMRAA